MMGSDRLAFFILGLVFSFFLSDQLATAQTEGQAVKSTGCEGQLYRAKRDGVPVFDEPNTTGTVTERLSVGERVCWVGERDNFAIIVAGPERQLRYVKLYDLWPPREKDGKHKNSPHSLLGGAIDSAKGQMQRILQGIPAEDSLAPYRQVLQPNPAPPPADASWSSTPQHSAAQSSAPLPVAP